MAPVDPKTATEGSVLLNVDGASSSRVPAFWQRIRENRETMTVVACGMFMVCSATMLIVNKVVVKHFATPVLVVLAQNTMACAIVMTVLRKSVRFGSRADAIRFAKVVPLMYAGMLITSAIAQQYASLGLQIVIRNLAPLVRAPRPLARPPARPRRRGRRWQRAPALLRPLPSARFPVRPLPKVAARARHPPHIS